MAEVRQDRGGFGAVLHSMVDDVVEAVPQDALALIAGIRRVADKTLKRIVEPY